MAEVEIVEDRRAGPRRIHLPGIYMQRLVLEPHPEAYRSTDGEADDGFSGPVKMAPCCAQCCQQRSFYSIAH